MKPIMPALGESIVTNVEGVQFRIREFDVDTALKISSKIIPRLGGIAKADGGMTLEKLPQLLTPELVKEIFDDCCKVSCVIESDGSEPELSQPLVRNRVFKRKTVLLYKWIFEVLKYNFEDFLAGFLARLQKTAAPVPE